MIPLRDDQPSFGTPAVTYFLIALNFLIYLFEALLSQRDLHDLFRQFALIPDHVALGLAGQAGGGGGAVFPMFTSMFLHGGWMHVIGNMWTLWIFGDNVEDRMGPIRFLFFYLLCGLAAGSVHWFTNPHSTIPTVGASGAIAGVMGAYLV